MRPSRFAAPLLALLIVAGCGGQADSPDQPASQAAGMAASRPRVQLDQPLSNEAARAAQSARAQAGVGFQQQESALVADGAAFSVDTGDREAVRLFFNRIYQAPTAPIEWTGSHASGVPGTTSSAFKTDTIRRVNWYRAMAGLPAAVRLSEQNSAKAQHAALIMSVAGQLSHYPAPDWKFYTQEGADAAKSSNLALGMIGPEAVDAYIQDSGVNNAAVGHRRWIFQPNTRTMGTGDVPTALVDGKTFSPANALWVTDVDYWSARPAVRDDFVAWPTRGFVPYAAVFERWSLSYPNADFAQARVSVTRDGVALAPVLEPVSTASGENTIVWKMPDIPARGTHARPRADVRYRVSVSNVVVAGQARSFDYEVRVMDPAVMTPGAAIPVASAPALARSGEPYTVRIGALPGATAYSLTELLRSPLASASTAPIQAGTWTGVNRGAHPILQQGALRFYFDGNEWGQQTATLNKRLYVASGSASVLVDRTQRYATAAQWFRVQASIDDGGTWDDIYSENGNDAREPLVGQLRLALGQHAGKMIRLRIASDVDGAAYIGPLTGWTVSAVQLEGVDELSAAREQRNAGGEFTVLPARPGNYLLLPRVELHRLYDTDPGVAALVAVDGALLSGPFASYTISRRAGVLTIVDNTGRDGSQTVRYPFRLDFTDLTLAFDVEGNAGQAYRLYRAAFNRQPDRGGIGFWIRGMDGGLTLEGMARSFTQSDEFAGLYGAAPTHGQVITALYRNVLGRAPDEAGAAYWLQQLANGMPLEQVLVAFSESAENKRQVAAEIDLGIAYTRQ